MKNEEAINMRNSSVSQGAEVLAPAGNYECFRAAINAGADAVYLGGSMFGARAFAGNFSTEELLLAIRTAHLHGRRVYLTVNTLLKNEELSRLSDYIRPYYEAGLDAAIVQDYGVFAALREEFSDLPLHASTQMTITGKYGARLLKDMGASRVVTARELSAAEIKDIHDNVDIEIESFVHGALCYCYSGQCFFSSMLGGRSGNRGRCAQPCRLAYSMNAIKEKYLLSPKDMCTLESIPDILEAGVFSLKIEGRMKSPEYVAGVTNAYRRYVDMYLEKGREGFTVQEGDIKQLMDLYNRGGFCKGYYYSHNDRSMMTFDRPNHQGIAVGTMKNGVLLLSEPVNAGDVLEFADGSEYMVPSAKKDGMPEASKELKFLKDFPVTKELKIPKEISGKQRNGSTVYRTRNNTLLSEIREEFIERDIKRPIRMSVSLKAGERAVLRLFPGNVTVYGDVLEVSDRHPAVRADVVKQLRKLGATAFSCEDGDILTDIEGNPFAPVKLLNDLRRNAIEQLEAALLAPYQRKLRTDIKEKKAVEEYEDGPVLSAVEENTDSMDNDNKEAAENMLRIQVMTLGQLEAVLHAFEASGDFQNGGGTYRIYLSTEIEGIDGAVAMKRRLDEYNEGLSGDNRRIRAYLAMPYIFRKNTAALFDRRLEDIIGAGFDGMLIRSPEELLYVREKGIYEKLEGRIVADYDMYTYNKGAFREYKRQGLYAFTISEELNAGQIRSLCKSVRAEGVELEKLVYGYLPLMVTAGCTLKYTSKDNPCKKTRVYQLADRKGRKLPALNACTYCYNLIYNSVPEYLLDKLDELADMGVEGMRVVLSIEDENESYGLVKLAIESMGACRSKKKQDVQSQLSRAGIAEYTRGHYNRGVD